MQRAISGEHRDRLIAAGYIREARRLSGSVYALVPTERGLRVLKRDLHEQSNALPKKMFAQRNIVDLNQNSEEHCPKGQPQNVPSIARVAAGAV
jgi:hypothetical protein